MNPIHKPRLFETDCEANDEYLNPVHSLKHSI